MKLSLLGIDRVIPKKKDDKYYYTNGNSKELVKGEEGVGCHPKEVIHYSSPS